ncbi:nucleotidyltransferase, partial [Candidatus Saccharibacteria bacterium]|nr:nucleotidyltransferase [Candidatus Saccharibacteria bacterium]
NSDVDLIIEKGNLKTYSDYYYFYDELEKNLGSNADLISSEKNLLPRFRTAINRDRILLYGL